MPTDDVLERAESLLAQCDGYELPPFTDSLIVEDLAAEVRELRKDRERLDWLETCQSITTGRDNDYEVIGVCRSNIDVAMKGEEKHEKA